MKIIKTIQKLFSKKDKGDYINLVYKKPTLNRKKPWKDSRTNQQFFSSEYKISYEPSSEQQIVKPISASQMKIVHKADQDERGKPQMIIVRKTVDDRMSRTVPYGSYQLTNGLNHELIWNRDYSDDVSYLLYVLGFNSTGVVNGTWILNHRADIIKFLSYMESLGAVIDWDSETGEFKRMTWADVKTASWLLFHAGCYKKKPAPNAFADDLFEDADRRAREEEQRQLQEEVETIPTDSAASHKSSRYDRPPSAPQVAYANQIYRRLLRAGYVNIGKPDLRSFGTVGKFIGTWQETYHQLGGSNKKSRSK